MLITLISSPFTSSLHSLTPANTHGRDAPKRPSNCHGILLPFLQLVKPNTVALTPVNLPLPYLSITVLLVSCASDYFPHLSCLIQ